MNLSVESQRGWWDEFEDKFLPMMSWESMVTKFVWFHVVQSGELVEVRQLNPFDYNEIEFRQIG